MNRIVIAVVVVLLTLAGFYRWGYGRGWGDRDADMQAAIAQKNEEARQAEQKMVELTNITAAKLQEANHALDQKQSALERAIRAGRVRLPAPSCVQAPAGAAAPAADSPEAPSESERQTLAAIAAIVADGDRAINQLNACIDQYNQVMEQINGSNH